MVQSEVAGKPSCGAEQEKGRHEPRRHCAYDAFCVWHGMLPAHLRPPVHAPHSWIGTTADVVAASNSRLAPRAGCAFLCDLTVAFAGRVRVKAGCFLGRGFQRARLCRTQPTKPGLSKTSAQRRSALDRNDRSIAEDKCREQNSSREATVPAAGTRSEDYILGVVG
jgi:hypothetical protein